MMQALIPWNACVHMYTCMRAIDLHTKTYAYTRVYVYIHIRMCLLICMCAIDLHTNTYAYIRVYVYTHIRMCILICMHVNALAHLIVLHLCVRISLLLLLLLLLLNTNIPIALRLHTVQLTCDNADAMTTECGTNKMCFVQNVFPTKCVPYRMCSL